MTLTQTPTVYILTLSCGHTQLTTNATHRMGTKYPCWAACDPENVTPAVVINKKVYLPKQGDAFVVCSGITDGDMAHVSRVVAEMNTKPKPQTRSNTLVNLDGLIDKLLNMSLGNDFIEVKLQIQMILELLNEQDSKKFGDIIVTWRKLGGSDGSLNGYMSAIDTLRNVIK